MINPMSRPLADYPAHIIDGNSVRSDNEPDIISENPYTGEQLWRSSSASTELLEAAISAAQKAQPDWNATPYAERRMIIESFTSRVKENETRLAELVATEAGKPIWEATIEVSSLISKFQASVEAYETRCTDQKRDVKGRVVTTRFRPHGVLAVIGPYNFPLSMANGHIMPAILAGNTIIFKPSELTPLCGIAMAELWKDAGLPKGVLNCLTGDGRLGKAMSEHQGINGILFVGSHSVGMSILAANSTHPEKIVAVEMGGNSPLIVNDIHEDKYEAAVLTVIQSTLLSSGQRCTAARRIFVHRSLDDFLVALIQKCLRIRIGDPRSLPAPYYGPIIRRSHAARVLNRFQALVDLGGRVLLDPRAIGPNRSVLTPGVIDMSDVSADPDEEVFGPIIKVYRYDDFDDAIVRANATKFGLASGLMSQSQVLYDHFLVHAHAGIVNWNQPLTGATTFAPFGGIKQSGNHRPAGFLSSDYCSYSTASFEISQEELECPALVGLGS